MAEFYSLAQSEDSTDVFLSHDWGKDEHGRNNHDRVSAVNDALKQLGYKTWFDSDKMTGDIVDTLCDGIDKTRIFLVFVTQRYAKEVQSGQDNDTRKLEFKYAMRRIGARNMIPVIMEERMKNPGDWKGPIGLALGGILAVRMYFDFSDMDQFRSGMSDLKKEIDARLNKMEVGTPHVPISSLKPTSSQDAAPQPSGSAAAQPLAIPAAAIPAAAIPAAAIPAATPQPVPQAAPSQPAPMVKVVEVPQVQQSTETILTIPKICNGRITGSYSLDLKELRFK